MDRFTIRTSILAVCLLTLPVFGQDNRVIRVGVPMMRTQAGRGVSADAARDQLVATLNQQKPDKKQHIKLQGVPLEGDSSEQLASEAKQKNCDYILYTSLVEVQAADNGMAPRQPGTVQPLPGGALGIPPASPNGGNVGPAYRATVDYRLYRTGDATAVSSASLTSQHSGSEETVVAQALNQVANRVLADVKKAPPSAQQ